MSPFVPKSWENAPSTATPLSAAALIDLETRLTTYVDATCRLTRTVAQSIPNNTVTTLAWDSEREDSEGMHVAGSTDVVIVTPGLYMLNLQASFAANATSIRALYLYKGTTVVELTNVDAASTGVTALTMSSTLRLVANDVVTAKVLQNSGGALDVTKAADYSPEFQVVRLGP
ncbi:MAG: hypothetical protein M3355_12135 [Actinomycetota bacterium]|nr:hypothetical protein [Actinomycetota bacterium]